MCVPVPRMLVAIILRRRSNRRRADRRHSALDGRPAGRRSAAQWYAGVRCLDGCARPRSGKTENQSVKIAPVPELTRKRVDDRPATQERVSQTAILILVWLQVLIRPIVQHPDQQVDIRAARNFVVEQTTANQLDAPIQQINRLNSLHYIIAVEQQPAWIR